MTIINEDITGKKYYRGNRVFMYGMRLRPFSIGCQPMDGLIRVEEDKTGKYWNILFYANPLNDHEQDGYELDYLGDRTEKTQDR